MASPLAQGRGLKHMESTVTEDMELSDARLARLEVRLSGLAEDMSDLKASSRDIAESLKLLAVLEERHRTADEAMKRLFTAIEKNANRIAALELQMPSVSLASSWVFRAVLFVMALTGVTYITMVIKGIGK